ncbi:UDP-N-acetylmuramoyl-L-alanine--D-glutamate ligase [uncultured Sneathiella sp.]|jgi:UDP-N-acetylmuramoylalanine--D-glutamate ligase|uniref:UDP-N-acetylmuramoyl-L-alanine--D-glutamate ligase n=1 Tax=uncultured Sneathiella sp. TaxID=879315 RepID=UPI0030D8E368|tara:strand:+ start:2023 stop:3411 length:1389 start_codon:yes stop_codon:yes gene_type:complete
MMHSHAYQHKNIAVFGLGKSGLATARQLHLGEAHVFVWDDDEARRKAALDAGLTVQDPFQQSWPGAEALILSPGVPLTHPAPHPVVELAKKAGASVIGDVEIFLQEKEAGRIIGITGTNGKSTTSALIHHLLSKAGKSSALGGNIGTPVMDLPELDEDGNYVLELSSYQLDLTPSWHADIAVLLNITPDHLDRHGDMAGYAAVKRRIFQRQNEDDVAIINIDDPLCEHIATCLAIHGEGRIIPVSTTTPVDSGVAVIDGRLEDRSFGDQSWTMDISKIGSLRGRHNWQNAAAAVAAARSAGLTSDEICAGLLSFGGLPHRMEEVGRWNNVLFINDSKATNAEAAEKALTSFDNIFWIAGGREKAGGITALVPHFGRIREAFLIGEAADNFESTLKGKVPVRKCNELEDAVRQAADAAFRSGYREAIVLLSPAAASFDQFESFEARGDAFRAAAKRLIGEAAS